MEPIHETEFDFRPLGQAIKQAREARGLTREQLSEALDKAPRHIQAIENEGQLPSLPLLVQLARMFDIPLDPYVFGDRGGERSETRRRVELLLDSLGERELAALEAALEALVRVGRPGSGGGKG